MASLELRILPVYSLYHPTASINGMRLLQHQVETQEAFHDPDIDVVINIAMTGDGKSIAGYLPAFQPKEGTDPYVIAMYPTNELIKDQYMEISGGVHVYILCTTRSLIVKCLSITRPAFFGDRQSFWRRWRK